MSFRAVFILDGALPLAYNHKIEIYVNGVPRTGFAKRSKGEKSVAAPSHFVAICGAFPWDITAQIGGILCPG